jgi:hypothetical protein
MTKPDFKPWAPEALTAFLFLRAGEKPIFGAA